MDAPSKGPLSRDRAWACVTLNFSLAGLGTLKAGRIFSGYAQLVTAFTEASAPALDALHQRHGLQFELLEGFLYPGHSKLRMHALPQRTGAALVAALQAASEQAGALQMGALMRQFDGSYARAGAGGYATLSRLHVIR